nr:MAG TPA: DNA-binding protein [Caudoviricetes sp.]
MSKNLKLKGYRTMLDLTQEQMANKLNITGPPISIRSQGKSILNIKKCWRLKKWLRK